jgi:hypothetical protein
MKRNFKASFIAATVVLATGAVALPAFARSVVAYAGGRSAFPGDASCFAEDWGGAKNNCATMKSYEISLPVDSPGSKNVWVNAYGASASNNVGCAAIGIDWAISTHWGGTKVYLPSFGSSATIVTGAYVPSGGSLYLYCAVDPGGRINSVNFDF